MGINTAQIISVLRSFISSKETYSSLVEEVLTKEQVQDKKYDSETYSFRHACVHWLPTDGFRHGSEPPLPLLINSGVQAVIKREGPFLHLLFCYLALEKETVEQIRAVIEAESQPKKDESLETVDGFTHFIEQIAEEVREKTDPPWDDSRLRVIIGASMIAPAGEEEEPPAEEESPVFTELMEIVEAVPPGDPFWGLMTEFFQKVEAVKAEKELATQTLEQLQTQLELLQEEYDTLLTKYFVLPIDGWQAEKVSLEQIPPILDQLSGLITMLDKYQALTLVEPPTVKERQALGEDQHRLEEQIATAWERLNEFFKAPKPPPVADEETESKPVEQRKESAVRQSPVAEPIYEVSEVENEAQASLQSAPPETETAVKVTTAPEERLDGEPLEKPPPEPVWRDDKVLAMLVAGDLAGAYWLARSREHLEKECPIPSWLIGAMEGSRYLLTPGFRLGKDFTYPIDYYLYNGDRFQELCALGVGLVSALVEPASNSALWLEPQSNLVHLQRIINTVRGFAKQGIQLNKRDLLAISSQERRNKMIVDAARRCKDLFQTHGRRRLGLPRANRIWRQLFGEGQGLRTALNEIIADRRGSLKDVKEILAPFSTSQKIAEVVENLDVSMMRKKDKPLPDHQRERISRMAAEITEAAQEWVDLVAHSDKDSNDWKQAQIARLVHDLQIYSKPCLEELADAAQTSGKESIAYHFISQNIKLLLAYLQSGGVKPDADAHWIFQDSETIEEVLAKRLLHHPELELNDKGLPSNNDLVRLDTFLQPQEHDWQRLPEKTYSAWLDKQDYRFLELVLQAIDGEEKIKEGLRECTARQQQGSQDNLEEYIRKTSINIEATLVNVGLTEEQRNEFISRVESIDSTTVVNFPPAFQLLRGIDAELETVTKRRVEYQTKIWRDFSPKLGEIASEEEAAALRDLVKKAMSKGDTRVVDEYITRVRDHLERKERLFFAAEREPVRHYLKEFSDFRRTLPRGKGGRLSVADRAVRDEKNWAKLPYASISPRQLEITEKAFTAWRNLSYRRKGSVAQFVTDLFTFLGFTITEPIKEQSFPSSWGHLHLALKMTASDQARPFPQFGSRAEPTFDVLMVWERPGADNLGTAINEAKLGVESTIVLYFGRISDSARQDMARMTRRRNLAVAILDETLFLFLSGERDAHLRAFLRCSVPYGTIIPYTPRIMGDVPPEIFYGREKAADLLLRRDGSCMVYGGRQMGKSALLRYVMRKAHNPERGQYAWVEDVKTLGDSYSREEPDNIWPRLWHLLANEGLVKGDAPEEEKIILTLERLLNDDKDLQIILMLDEADNFLNRDAVQGFKTVSQFRNLMTDSERRFKAIFAGLQHVQRFQGMPNQPLAHFGDPILVGPLEEQAAAALVREPLEALGFALNDACVYRILSFTNYHPGLIQYFCYHLLERLYRTAPVFPTPFKPLRITREDVETIYLQDDIRERIKERFEWTLALDPRYQVIVWAMIVAQTTVRDSFGRQFSVGDLYSLARDYWPAEFSDMASDEFRGILRELVGLGILATPEDRYRLKSPNLVRIMGDEEDIGNRLYSFLDEPALEEMEADSYHEQMDDKAQLYSAFTFEQARSIDRKLDMRVFTASQALNLEHMEDSIKHLYATAENTVLRRIPVAVDSAQELQRLIRKERDRAKKGGKDAIVLYQVVDKAQTTPLETIKAAYAHYLEELKRRRPRNVSIFFVINPVTFWELLKLDAEFMGFLNEEGLIAGVKLWNDRGIGQRLDNYNKLSNDEARRAISEAGGRWPYLLSKIMMRCGQEKDPRSAADEVKDLLTADDEFRKLFLAKLDLPEEPIFHGVLELISKHVKVPLDLIVPEYGGSLGDTSDKQCKDAVEVLEQYGLIKTEEGVATIDSTVEMVLFAK